MADKIVYALNEFFVSPALTVLIISMFPLIELKGAIPVGLKSGLPLLESAGLAYLGSTVVCVGVFFLLLPIFKLLKKIGFVRLFIAKVEGVFTRKAEELDAKAAARGAKGGESSDKLKLKLLLLFVAVPFPVTGVWTGTAIAVFLGLKFKNCFPMIALGNLIAGAIITLLTFFFADYVDYIILGMLALAIIMLIIFIIKVIITPEHEKNIKNQK